MHVVLFHGNGACRENKCIYIYIYIYIYINHTHTHTHVRTWVFPQLWTLLWFPGSLNQNISSQHVLFSIVILWYRCFLIPITTLQWTTGANYWLLLLHCVTVNSWQVTCECLAYTWDILNQSARCVGSRGWDFKKCTLSTGNCKFKAVSFVKLN